MKLDLRKLLTAAAFLLLAVPAFSQNYPMPSKVGQPPATYNGMATWQYSSPIEDHVGRIVDSLDTASFQGGTGFRTARAGLVRIARTTRGAAPPRAYIQIGSAIGVYSLDRFFTTSLPAGMVSIGSAIGYSVQRGDYIPEKVLDWDSVVYPEHRDGSGWYTPSQDGQDRLADFDFDDRGYVYVAATGIFGWGIVRDEGKTNGALLPLVFQGYEGNNVSPIRIASVKAGSTYYMVTSDIGGGRESRNVNNPASPGAPRYTSGPANGFYSWAKDDARGRIAIATGEYKIAIYDNESFATGGSPLVTFSPASGKKYLDVTADDDGNFWTVEGTKYPETGNHIVKLERTASGYTRRTFEIDAAFTPAIFINEGTSSINYGGGYLGLAGKTRNLNDALLYKIENGEPVLVDLHGYFNKYYHAAPSGYTNPESATIYYGAYPVKWGTRTYLIYNVHTLGDVYEIQTGDSISVSKKSGTFGTVNPNAKPQGSGPFYGDILKFTSTSSNPSFQYNVTWNFDNPEAGSDNSEASITGQDVTHQFTGLDTSGEITAIKQVRATANVDSEMNDSVSVSLVVPTARIGLKNTDFWTSTDGASIPAVVGDELTDASDGEKEGHYSAWTVAGVGLPAQAPDQTVPLTTVGARTVRLDAKYGKYNGSFVTTGNAFTDSVTNVSVDVRPFYVAFKSPSSTSTTVTFKGEARKTSLTSILPATTWTVRWSLTKDGVDIADPQESVDIPVGQIPDYLVTNKGSIQSGSILTLRASVDPDGLGAGISADYLVHEITQTLVVPAPTISRSGCGNVGASCTLNVTNFQPGWTIQWTLKKGATTVDTFNGNPYSPVLSESGEYTATAKAVTAVFEGSDTESFDVAAPVCGEPPTSYQMSIWTSCSSGCPTGQAIDIEAQPWQYTLQGCEQFRWQFGDGQSANTSDALTSHSYSSSGSKTIRLVVRKDGADSTEFTKTITIGTSTPPPDTSCTKPSGIQITYLGTKGCAPGGAACQTGESVKFTAKRGTLALQSCDSAAWTLGDGDSTTSKSPSKTFATPGTRSVTVVISNVNGSANMASISVPVVQASGACGAPPTINQMVISYAGQTSGCTNINGKTCQPGEQVKFTPGWFNYTPQGCEQFEWNFGDNTATSSLQEPTHAYAGGQSAYTVSMRVYTSANTTGATTTVNVPFSGAPILQLPTLSWSAFPVTGTKGKPATFTASSNISATGWLWNFGDGTGDDSSKSGTVGTTSTISHTFANTGTFYVTVRARNSADSPTAPLTTLGKNIPVEELAVKETRYLLPVVVHITGQNNSTWRTDVQVYNPDRSVNSSNPLVLKVIFEGKELDSLGITKSTHIYEDFLYQLIRKDGAGPVILSTTSQNPPQIWTRTYNQTEHGTYGQFIPAIRLDDDGGAAAAVDEGQYHIAGLRSDDRYRTNLGFVNPTVSSFSATITIFDGDRIPLKSFPQPLNPFQFTQLTVDRNLVPNLPADGHFSVEVNVPSGKWVIAYASLIDGMTNDPVFLSAVEESSIASEDFREIILPGVSHTGQWRSDVTVFNPDGGGAQFDLTYYDLNGNKQGEALNVPLSPLHFVEWGDALKQGIIGNAPDGAGIFRLKVKTPHEVFPMAFARTYFDSPEGTYGQGIDSFSAARPNVRPNQPALIPAVRDDEFYYTNIGLVNVSTVDAVATVTVLNPDTGDMVKAQQYVVKPNQMVIGRFYLSSAETTVKSGTLKVETTGGSVWAFASVIDQQTKDPEYVPASPLFVP